MAEENHDGIRFTSKEMFARIDAKLDSIEAKLDTKADNSRVTDLITATSALERRVNQIETTMVRREGPIIDEIREYEARVTSLEMGVNDRIRQQLQETMAAAQAASDRSWSIRDKIIIGICTVVSAVGTLVSMYVAVKVGV